MMGQFFKKAKRTRRGKTRPPKYIAGIQYKNCKTQFKTECDLPEVISNKPLRAKA